MLKTIISFILKISLDHPKKIMAGIMLVTIMCLFKISFLEFQFNIDEFLDDNQPQKILYRKILDEFNNDSNFFIIASGHNDSLKDFSSSINTLIKSFPHWIASIGNNISRDYLKKNMIKLFDLDELKEFDDIYNDPNLIQLLININNFFESHYLKSESLTNKQKKKLNDFINKLFHFVRIQKNIIIDELDLDNSSKAVNALLFGNGKSFSDDGKNMMIMIEPDYNMNLSMKKQIHSVNTIRMIIYDMAARHGVECSLVGPLAMKVDFFENFFVESKYMIMLSIISIFFILISLFRFYTSFNFCFIPIIFSFIWILGLYGFVFNALNLISIISAISCIVFILINCILFLLSCNKKNSEMNFVNDFFSEYAVKLFKTSLFLSSFSFIIYFSEVKFISMIGLMIGLGLIVSTILVLIIFSVMLAENKKKYHQYFYNDFTFDSLNNCFNFMFNFINKKRKIVFLFLSVFTCFSLFNSVNLVFEKSPSKIFHNHNENIELDFIEKFKFSSELFSYVVSDIDSARKIKKDLEHNELVGFVESFSDFVPNDNVEQERFRFIFEFNRKIRLRQLNKFFSTYEVEAYKNEIKRLEANFIELQHIAQINEDVDLYDKTKQLVGDGGPEGLVGLLTYFIGAFDDDFKKTRLIFFQDSFFGNMKSTLLDMANTEPVDISNIPYDIKKRLSNDANDQFRINVYSNFNTLFLISQ